MEEGKEKILFGVNFDMVITKKNSICMQLDRCFQKQLGSFNTVFSYGPFSQVFRPLSRKFFSEPLDERKTREIFSAISFGIIVL